MYPAINFDAYRILPEYEIPVAGNISLYSPTLTIEQPIVIPSVADPVCFGPDPNPPSQR